MNPIILQSMKSELIKIAEKSLRDKASDAAPYAGGAAAAGLAATYVGVKDKNIPMGTGEILIYYTDPRRGHGHYAQGKALANKLRSRGHQVRLINFDKEFGDPARLKKLNESFSQALRGKKGAALRLARAKHLAGAHFPFYANIDFDALKRQAGGDKRVVLAHAGLESVVRGLGKPVFVLHTDQSAWNNPMIDIPSKGLGKSNIHIAAATAVKDIEKQTPSLKGRIIAAPGLAIDEPQNTKQALRKPGKFNITVSGGGLGLNTADMTKAILANPNLKKGTVIHAVAGRGLNLPELRKLEKATKGKPVQVRAYAYAPLRNMMNEADVNVLRPHGTSITEARAAGKPFLMYLPKGKKKGMDVNNARAVSQSFGVPLVDVDSLGGAVQSISSNYSSALAKAKKYSLGTSGGAETIAKGIEDTKAVRMLGRTGARWNAARALMAGAAVGGLASYGYKEGLELRPSKSNPQVKRWQRRQ